MTDTLPALLMIASGSIHAVVNAIVKGGKDKMAAREQWRPGVTAGMLSIVTYGLALTALSLGPTAPLAALRETGMVTALGISILVMGEKATARRIAAMFAILAGATLILVA